MDELLSGSRWFQMGVVLGCLAIGAMAVLGPRSSTARATLLRRLHLVHACVIAFQALGHVTAISIKAEQGTLTTTKPLEVLYGVGLVYLIPSLLLGWFAFGSPTEDAPSQRRLLILDIVLAVALIVAIFPGPLAIPAILNIVALRRDSERAQRRVVIGTVVVYAAMFVASFFFDGP